MPVASPSRTSLAVVPRGGAPLRVLMLGFEFPPHLSGGLGTACLGLTRALDARGVEVTFVVPRLLGGEASGPARLLGARDVAIDDDAPAPSSLAWLAIDSPLAPYLDEAGYAARVAHGGGAQRAVAPWHAAHVVARPGRVRVSERDLASAGPYGADLVAEVARYATAVSALATGGAYDVVHGHDWTTWPAAHAAAHAAGAPFVAHVHATEHDRCGPHGDPAIVEVERRALAAADVVVCVSRYTARVVRRRYGVPAARLRVVHNGAPRLRAPRRRAAPAPRPPTVLFLGRVTRQKGPETFLRAAARIARVAPRTRFVVAGSGDLLPRMIERAAELGLAGRVRFTGFVSGDAVARLYARADVYAMPSESEPFGLAPLEALACGVPVVLSSRSGVAEVLRGAPTVAPRDDRALARKVLALLRAPRTRRRLVREGRARARTLSWSRAAAAVERVYREVLA